MLCTARSASRRSSASSSSLTKSPLPPTLASGASRIVSPWVLMTFSDTLTPGDGAEAAFIGDQGVAAVARAAAGYRTAFLAFPLEAVADEDDRRLLIERFLDACALLFADGFESGDATAWSTTVP